MNLALCYPSVLPVLGGCESYIAALARRLVADGHEVHLYASRWDADSLPVRMFFHPIQLPWAPRCIRPWLFSQACSQLLAQAKHDVSIGFDKIYGVDVYYPQGGDYPASVRLSQDKYPIFVRTVLRWTRWFDPAHQSLLAIERRQLSNPQGMILAISGMVRNHLLERPYVSSNCVHVLPIAAMPERMIQSDRAGRRGRFRCRWGLDPQGTVGLFAGINLRLKGLEPLLRALACLTDRKLELIVAGAEPTQDFIRLSKRLQVSDRIRFVGYLTDMCDAYYAADLLVHPTFYDPCANVVLEALGCGLPVITTTRNGASEQMIRIGDGGRCAEGFLLEDPHDHETLARWLRALTNPILRDHCATAALQAAARWTFEDHYRALVRLLQERVAARKESPLRAAA